jgi:hypothetical protein
MDRGRVYLATPALILATERYDVETLEQCMPSIRLCEQLAQICKALGLGCYVPHEETPAQEMAVHGHEVWDREHEQIGDSELVLANVTPDLHSVPVASAIGIADKLRVPVFLVYDRANAPNIDLFLRQCPAVQEVIGFNDPRELEMSLVPKIWYTVSKRHLDKLVIEKDWRPSQSLALYQRLDALRDNAREAMRTRPFSVGVQVIGKDEWWVLAQPQPPTLPTLFDDNLH